MKKVFNLKFDFGECVYLKSDPDRKMRIINGYLIRKNLKQYGLGLETNESFHDETEIESFKSKIFHVKGFVG